MQKKQGKMKVKITDLSQKIHTMTYPKMGFLITGDTTCMTAQARSRSILLFLSFATHLNYLKERVIFCLQEI